MKAIWIVLIKGLVTPFYKRHAGLLLVVFLLMFGVVESSQIVSYHQALIHEALTSKWFLAVVMISWVLYSIKSVMFLLTTSNENAYQFLNVLSILPARQSYLYYLGTSALVFIPVLTYTLFIYGMAISCQCWASGLSILICQLVLISTMALVLNHRLRNRHQSPILKMPALKLPAFNNLFGIYVKHLLRNEKVALLLSKSLSMFLLYFVRETLVAGDDNRIIGITWLFALLTHIMMILKLKTFEDDQLTWQLGLPISVAHRYVTYAGVYLVMMIPELFLLITCIGNGVTPIYCIALAVLTIGFFTFIHSYLYKRSRNTEQFVKYILWFFLFSFVLVLSKLIWVAASGYIIVSYARLTKRFYRYEKGGI